LKEKSRDLFEVCNEQKEYVVDIARRWWRLTFRRWLDETAQNQLRQLRYSNNMCPRAWKKYTYLDMGKTQKFFLSKPCMLTSAELILKITIRKFGNLRYLWKLRSLCGSYNKLQARQKDNLAKINWQGDKSCKFCNLDECVNHLFYGLFLSQIWVW
jgi:hypothetical protein